MNNYKFKLSPEECEHKISTAFFDIIDYTDVNNIQYDVKSYCCDCGIERTPTAFEYDELLDLFHDNIVAYRLGVGPIYYTTLKEYAQICAIQPDFDVSEMDEYQRILTKCVLSHKVEFQR